MKWVYRVAFILIFIQPDSFADTTNTGIPWFTVAGGCWRRIDAYPAPGNPNLRAASARPNGMKAKSFPIAMVTGPLNGLSVEQVKQQCSESRREALEMAARWATSCCYAVQFAPNLGPCPNGPDNDVVNTNINVTYALFNFTVDGKASNSPITCELQKPQPQDPPGQIRRYAKVNAICYDGRVTCQR